MNLIEAEDIKKRWQEYTEELYKKDLHDPDNHNDMITHLEPDILECEVKWAVESITTNKASGGDGIPVELFQILKDDAVKVLHSICQQIWKLSSGHRTGKGQFSFQSQRKAMPKTAQTTTQWHSSLMLCQTGCLERRRSLEPQGVSEPVFPKQPALSRWGWTHLPHRRAPSPPLSTVSLFFTSFRRKLYIASLNGKLASLIGGFSPSSVSKESPCSAGDRIQSLSWEDHLKEEMASRSSILA